MAKFEREAMDDGSVQLRSERCTMTIKRLRAGVVQLTIVGYDAGEFAGSPFEEMHAAMMGFGPVEMFADLSQAFGATTAVREEWTEWFRRNQAALRRVNFLAGSKYMEMAVAMAKLFSRTGELIQLYSSRQAFDEAISRSLVAAASG
jgi:hypothetical protein